MKKASGTGPRSVAEYAAEWTAILAARPEPGPTTSYSRPAGPRFVIDPRIGSKVLVEPSETGVPEWGPAGTLDAPLSETETACLDSLGLGHLREVDAAPMGVSLHMFLRIVMSIRETAFTRLVTGMARARGVLVHHCGRAENCEGGPGFPDLTLAGDFRVMFAELKCIYDWADQQRGYGVREPAQVAWGARLDDAYNGLYVVWTPADLPLIPAALDWLSDPAAPAPTLSRSEHAAPKPAYLNRTDLTQYLSGH